MRDLIVLKEAITQKQSVVGDVSTPEKNKLIAGFLGLIEQDKWSVKVPFLLTDNNGGLYNSPLLENTNYQEYLECYTDEETGGNGLFIHYEELRFSSSWNWMMHVIDSIERLNYKVTLSRNYFSIGEHKDNYIIETNFLTGNKLEGVYHCVVSFIEYLNKI